MPIAESLPTMTADEYLKWEERAEVRHEYLDGEIFAHAGASDAHVTITGNLFSLLRAHLRGGPCRVYMLDMKLRVEDEAFFYPDVFVTCDPEDRTRSQWKETPILAAEILFESTAGFDRGRKFAQYRTRSSLREYVLVDTEQKAIEVFRLGPDGRWVLYPFEGGEGAELELESLGFRCPMDAVYEDVELDEGRLATDSSTA